METYAMNKLQLVLVTGLGLGLLIQLIPVNRTNPPSTGELQTQPAVSGLLKRACYDCHSHETRWPWYSHVAPIAWLLAHDVKEGRDHLNFSAWTGYTTSGKNYLREKMIKEIGDGDMPPAPYAWMHREAVLSAEDLKVLKDWANAEKDR